MHMCIHRLPNVVGSNGAPAKCPYKSALRCLKMYRSNQY